MQLVKRRACSNLTWLGLPRRAGRGYGHLYLWTGPDGAHPRAEQRKSKYFCWLIHGILFASSW